jgi:hypothetical protein
MKTKKEFWKRKLEIAKSQYQLAKATLTIAKLRYRDIKNNKEDKDMIQIYQDWTAMQPKGSYEI